MTRIELRQLCKEYAGGVRAVDGVDLTIQSGEFVVLVGPSGCGKSTTLRMIAGLEEISGGDLLIDDERVNETPARERDLAMVFQSYALYPHLDVRSNLAFPLERQRTHKSRLRRLLSSAVRDAARVEDESIARRVDEAAETLGLAPLLDRKPGELSGGQRQRVAVGRALVRAPRAYLFDEPLSNLDARLRLEMRTELKALHRSTGATMVYVTHDQEEAMTLGDRLVVMKDGEVQQIGSPQEVYARPANRFVAGFLGSPPMNFLSARVGASGTELEGAGGARLSLEPGRALEPGQAVVVGVRPDRLRVGGAQLRAELELVEDLGDRRDYFLRLEDGQRVVCRGEHADAELGAALSLGCAPSDLHVFEDAAAGARLC